MNALRDWLAGLAPRERNLVYLAGGLAAIALAYLVLVLPLTTAAARREARIEQKTADLAWMRQVAPQVAAAAAVGGAAAGSEESLVVLVDRTGREAGIGSAIRDQSPSGDLGLRLRLESASFDVLVAWLASLQQQYGVRVDAATIDAAGSPGLVNASITLTHGTSSGP
jgi:general secretion pathway protein M